MLNAINSLLKMQRELIRDYGDKLRVFEVYEKIVIDRRCACVSIEWEQTATRSQRLEEDFAHISFISDADLQRMREQMQEADKNPLMRPPERQKADPFSVRVPPRSRSKL